MTNVDLQFRLDRTRSLIYISSMHAKMTANTLPSNVDYVSFANGVGQIIYSDRQRTPESFTDPSPYQTYVNQWITAMATATPPLTLAQAIAIKQAFISTIYNLKRHRGRRRL